MEILDGVGNPELFFSLVSMLVISFFLYRISIYLLYRVLRNLFHSVKAPGRTRAVSVDCCICLGETQLGLETSCGHIFCGDCILNDFDSGEESVRLVPGGFL